MVRSNHCKEGSLTHTLSSSEDEEWFSPFPLVLVKKRELWVGGYIAVDEMILSDGWCGGGRFGPLVLRRKKFMYDVLLFSCRI